MSAIGCGLNGSLQHHTAVTVKKDQGGPRTANHIVKTDTQSVEEFSLGRVVSLSPFGKVQVRPRHDGSGSLIEDDDPIATLIR